MLKKGDTIKCSKNEIVDVMMELEKDGVTKEIMI